MHLPTGHCTPTAGRWRGPLELAIADQQRSPEGRRPWRHRSAQCSEGAAPADNRGSDCRAGAGPGFIYADVEQLRTLFIDC